MADIHDRRSGDALILKMHGNIETLLERTKNTNGQIKTMVGVQEAQNQKFEEHDARIAKNEGSIRGIRWVGGLVSLLISGFLGLKGDK